jgi:hypothetical protein
VGTTDRAKQFHPFGLAVCSTQDADDFYFVFQSIKDAALLVHGITYDCDTLIADNAKEITNGFSLAFGPPRKRINCLANFIRSIDKNLMFIKDKDIRKLIRQDIYQIQATPDASVISTVFKLFEAKWRSLKINSVNVFLDYFRNWTLDGQNGWFEGYCMAQPSHFSSIKAHHETMKTYIQPQKKLKLLKYITIIYNVIFHVIFHIK